MILDLHTFYTINWSNPPTTFLSFTDIGEEGEIEWKVNFQGRPPIVKVIALALISYCAFIYIIWPFVMSILRGGDQDASPTPSLYRVLEKKFQD